jgi:hypothetical protein
MATPLQPGSVQPTSGQVTRQFVSDLSILKPQYYDKFIEKYGSQNYTQLLEALGMKATVPSREFFHFETRGKLHSAVQLNGGALASVAPGAAVDVEISSAFVNGGKSPLRVGEVVENAATGAQYKITAVASATVCTIKPLSSTIDANDDLGANSTAHLLFRGITEAGEASSKFSSLTGLTEKKTFYTTEIREDFSITDRAKIEELYFEVNGQAYYTYKGLDEAVRRFMNNKEFKLMFGKPTDNISGTVGTTGLIPQVEAGGQTYQWNASSSGFTIEDFHALARLADFNGGSSEYHFLMDSYLRTVVDDAIFSKYTAGAIQWAAVGGSQEVAIKYGFDSIKIDGTTFHLKKYLPFNAEAVYGVAPTTEYYKNSGILIPVKEGRDAQTGDKIPSLRIVSNEVEPGKDIKVWETGALAKVPTSDKMELNVHHMAYCGIQLFGANQYINIKP